MAIGAGLLWCWVHSVVMGTRDQVEIDPNAFPVGSTGWWNSMDALDRGGQGNGQGGF